MRNWMIAAAALCLAPMAAAQDAPKEAPAKHVNKVSDAAKAALEKIASLAYTPIKGGLKDLTGAVKMEMEAGEGGGGRMGGMGKMDLTFAVAFKAPDDLKVEWKDAPAAEGDEAGMAAKMMKRMAEGMNLAVSKALRSTILGWVPASDSEFDADVKVENGVTTILMTHYLKGVETSRNELILDEHGLPQTIVTSTKVAENAPPAGPRGRGMGGADGKSTAKITYAKEGDLFRVEKMTMDSPQGPMDMNFAYADAGKFKVVKSWEMATPGGGMKFAFRFSDLVVNGKALDLSGKAPAAGEKGEKGEKKE